MVDKQLLHMVMQKLGQTPRTYEQARETLPEAQQQQASIPELMRLAEQQQQSARWRYGTKPGVQTAATGVAGAGLGAALGGMFGGKQALLPGAIMGGFIALIAKFFFKDQFAEAFKWLNQTLQRPDATQVLAKVKQQLSQADRSTGEFLEQFDPNVAPVMLDAYKKELDTTSKTTGEQVKLYQKADAQVKKELARTDLNEQQRQQLMAQQQQIGAKLQEQIRNQQSLAGVRSYLEQTEQAGPFYQPQPMSTPAAAQHLPASVPLPGQPQQQPQVSAMPEGTSVNVPTPPDAGKLQRWQEQLKQQMGRPVGEGAAKKQKEALNNPFKNTRKELPSAQPQTVAEHLAGWKHKLTAPGAGSRFVNWAFPQEAKNVQQGLQQGQELVTKASTELDEISKLREGLQKKLQGAGAAFQKYKKPMMMMAGLPLLMSMMNMFSGFGQASQMGNVARALQRQGTTANPYMQKQRMTQQNPYMGAFRRNI